MNIQKNYSGFTLIETIIYVVLVGFMLTALVFVTYQLLSSGDSINAKILVQGEADFAIRKVEWAFSSAESISVVDNVLSVYRYGAADPIVFSSDRQNFLMNDIPLNNARVKIENLVFTGIGSAPDGVEMSFMINGSLYESEFYRRNI